jgi:hypothetical protein
MIIPKNKIAIIPIINDLEHEPFDMESISTFLTPLKKNFKRDWFDKNFYRCLPISLGNIQGFVISVPFDFDIFWTGGNSRNDLIFNFYEDEKNFHKKCHVNVESHFGYGILTINLPIIFKTPPNVNLMTISPPNFLIPGLTPITSVIETDNLRYSFGLSIKVDINNIWIKIKKNSPLIGIIPIPRNFCDNFEIVNAYDILDKEEVEEERKIAHEHFIINYNAFNNNKLNKKTKTQWNKTYLNGTDIRGNKFKNYHQTLREKK